MDNSILTKGIINNGAYLPASTDGTAITNKIDTVLQGVMPPVESTGLIVQKNNIMEEKEQADGGIRVVQLHEECLMAQELSDDEKAVESDGDFDELEVIRKRIATPASHNMANIQGILNNSLYAVIVEDENGTRYVEYCQRYSTGSYSGRMKILQSDILEAYLYRNTADKEFTAMRKKIMKNVRKEYLGKFRGDAKEALNIENVLEALAMVLSVLPEQADSNEHEMWEFYGDTIDIIRTLSSQVGICHKHFYALMEEDIDYVALKIGMRRDAFLRKLKKFDFLYLNNSSTKYKTNVKINCYGNTSYTEWCYCIWKLNLEIDKNSDTKCWFDF